MKLTFSSKEKSYFSRFNEKIQWARILPLCQSTWANYCLWFTFFTGNPRCIFQFLSSPFRFHLMITSILVFPSKFPSRDYFLISFPFSVSISKKVTFCKFPFLFPTKKSFRSHLSWKWELPEWELKWVWPTVTCQVKVLISKKMNNVFHSCP